MNLKLITGLLLCMLFQNAGAQTIDVSVSTSDIPESSFIGGSTEFMYPILRGNPNEDTTSYDTIFVSDLAIDALSELNLNYLRFPGGTISQYYHFAGPNGYGTIDFDLDCRPGYINIPGFKQKVNVDGAYPGNMIEQYISLHRQLEQEQGNSIKTLYVINLMSHFFAGDFVPVNSFLDALIDSYGEDLGVLLDVSPSFLTDELMADVIAVMLQAYNDPVVDQLIEFLVTQEPFQLRLAENIAAINHLLNNDIDVAGVELGNENYAFTMLKDDDLSDIPYDCTTPDSVIQSFGNLTLPLRSYMQGVLKYAMITELYDTVVNELFDLPTGVVISATQFNVDLIGLDDFEINEVKTEKYRYHELWNRFIGSLNYYDAAIPHIYMKSQPVCDALGALEIDSLELYGKSYIDYYFNDVLDYQLNRILTEINDKTLWITEWNMNTANVFGNTFLQGSYVFQFMNELNRTYWDYNIDLINFHNLAAWRYNQFAVLRTDEDSTGYMVLRQSMFEPFKLMGELHRDMHVLGEADMMTWLGNDYRPAPDQYYYTYFDELENELIVHFINQSGEPIEMLTTGKNFQFEIDGQALPVQSVGSFEADYMDAESFLASNEGCSDYASFFDDYVWKNEVGTSDLFTIPGWSIGRLKMQMELATRVEDISRINFNIHPNPASGTFKIHYAAGHSNELLYLAIYDITGRNLQNEQVINGSAINVAHLPDGIYMVQLTGDTADSYGIKKTGDQEYTVAINFLDPPLFRNSHK